MPQSKSKPKPSSPAKPGLEIKPVQDLEPDESQSGNVRGGAGLAGLKFSDAALKGRVEPLKGALAKLRTLRF